MATGPLLLPRNSSPVPSIWPFSFATAEREPNGVIPGVNGTVIFDWQGTDQSYLEIEVTEPFHAECMYISPGKPTRHWTIEHRPFFSCSTTSIP